ncbi:MAG: hypothetical protein V7L20_23075 [Nostoc sp.]|uniref:hypothetical protein n=1 Tax=Nostoc sp. TaxID=1180 RepID=UPI002FF64C6D
MTELYKAGIIKVTEAEDEDENLFEVAVHFDGDIFFPALFLKAKITHCGKQDCCNQAMPNGKPLCVYALVCLRCFWEDCIADDAFSNRN